MSFDFESIGRILDAARLAGVDVPLELRLSFPYKTSFAQSEAYAAVRRARSALGSEIEWAFTLENIQPTLTSNNKSKVYSKKLQEIANSARRLSSKIYDDPHVVNDLGRHVSDRDGMQFYEILQGLSDIAVAAEDEIIRRQDAGILDQSLLSASELGLASTPGFTFIEAMANCFTKTFSKKATVYRLSSKKPGANDWSSSEKVGGPFVAFVNAVTREHGKAMSGSAIERAFKRWKLSSKI